MTIRSAWHINSSQTREDTRFNPIGTMVPGAGGALDTYNGVIPTSGDPMKLTSTGAMTAQIEVGRAVVQGSATQGCYPAVITAPEAVTFSDGHASLDRIDSVVIMIRDDAYDSSGFTDIRVVVVQGTPAASPTAPTGIGNCYLPLHDVLIPAGTSAGGGGINWGTNVTDKRKYTVAVGGIAVGAVPGAYAGQYRDSGGSTGTLSRYNGTAWESTVRLDSAGQLIIGDTNWRRDGSNIMATDDVLRVYRGATTDNALSFRLPADSASRFFMNADGSLYWGIGGSTPTDTNLYRLDVDTLKTDSKFRSEVEVVTSGVTGVASGWSLNSFFGRRTAQVVTVDLYVNRTGTTITGGDFADIQLCTLPVGWRPQHSTISGFWDNGGTGFGGSVVGTDGLVSLRNSSGNIATGTNLRIQYIFIQVN